MAQINHKAVRSLSKLMEAGFDSEKGILNMTMDDILSLPGITVAEIGMINEIQKAVKAGKWLLFWEVGKFEYGENDLFYGQPGKAPVLSAGWRNIAFG